MASSWSLTVDVNTGNRYDYYFAEKPKQIRDLRGDCFAFYGTDPDDGSEMEVGISLRNVEAWLLQEHPDEEEEEESAE